MNTEQTIWSAHRRSVRNVRRTDARMKIVFVVGIVLGLAAGVWSASRLIVQLRSWQAIGLPAVEANLWLVCVGGWAAITFLAILALRQHGFASDESLLLFTLPIPSASRFRALYGQIFIEELANWLLLSTAILGVGLGLTLHWTAAIWIALLVVGALVSTWCGIVVTLLVVQALILRARLLIYVALALLVGLLLSGLALAWYRPGTHVSIALNPGLATGMLLVLLLLMLWPGSGWAGTLYEQTFQAVQSQAQARKVRYLPGVRALMTALERYRTPTAALCTKGILRQSRSFIAWLRIGAIALYLLPFGWARVAVVPQYLSDLQLVVVYVTLLFILTMIDGSASPVGGEGNRLTLYLTAPISGAAFLRAKLIVLLIPMLFGGLLVISVLSWWANLSPPMYISALALAGLIITGSTMLFVYGSTWDADLGMEVEGAIQALVLEEAPITPRRIMIVNLSLVLVALQLFLVWTLSTIVAIVVLTLIDSILLVALRRFGDAQLRRLTLVG